MDGNAKAIAVTRSLLLWVIAAAALLIGAAAALAQENASDDPRRGETRNCIDLREIERTEVVDEDTILFRMRSGEVLRNDLQNRCPTLDDRNPFMYRVALNQLCSIDTITVLQDVGFGFVPGPTCLLGRFQPIDESEAEELISAAADRRD